MRNFILLILAVISLNASYVERGHPYEYATLQYIRIGDDFAQSCFTFKMLVQQNDKNQKVESTNYACGYVQDDIFFGLEGDSEGVSAIILPVEYFGYTQNIDHKYVAMIAQDYLNSETPMHKHFKGVAVYNSVSKQHEAHFYGHNEQHSVMMEITYRYISMKKEKDEYYRNSK